MTDFSFINFARDVGKRITVNYMMAKDTVKKRLSGEANDYLGGHTHTHDLEIAGCRCAVDTGFIVFNAPHYPLLNRLFDDLRVASQPTTMSFALKNERSGLEYNATNLPGLFCQPRNLVSPRFWRMLADLRRFYREAPALLDEAMDIMAEVLVKHE